MSPNASNSTNAATHAALNQASQTKPEWLRVPDAVRIFGVCRSSLYELITNGAVKSTALRKRGAVRGIRLISFDSLAAYIENAASKEGGL
jgi:hypothetical protein